MEVHVFRPNVNEFEALRTVDDHNPRQLVFRTSETFVSDKPIEVRTVFGNRPLGDFPYLYGPTPCLSERAWNALSHLIAPDVQRVQLRLPTDEVFFALNIVAVVDCLDLPKCRYSYNPILDGITFIHRYSFNRAAIGSHSVFRAVQVVDLEAYVTDVFFIAVERAKLIGLQRWCVWQCDDS